MSSKPARVTQRNRVKKKKKQNKKKEKKEGREDDQQRQEDCYEAEASLGYKSGFQTSQSYRVKNVYPRKEKKNQWTFPRYFGK